MNSGLKGSGPRLLVWLVLALAAGRLCAAPGGGEDAPADAIQVVQIQGGLLEVMPRGATRWYPVATGAVLRAEDRVRTGPNTRATLRWSDQSVVPMDVLTELEILPPHEKKAQFGLNLLRGIISFFHRDRPGRIRAVTRGAAAGVEGTEFVLQVKGEPADQETILSVIDGRVRFYNELDTLVLTNGEQAVAAADKPPLRTPGFIANNVLQWSFYYPAVLDLSDTPFTIEETQALAESLQAYRAGDLLTALTRYPSNRVPETGADRIYYAQLLLAVGQVSRAETLLADLLPSDPSGRLERLAGALRQQIAAVKREPNPASQHPELSTELLAASYYEQSRGIRDESLGNARALARRAVALSPDFGFAWERLAELEFSFGRMDAAVQALERSLEVAPRNAQALALRGFLHAARNRAREALVSFEEALAVDSGLGNAWLGRGLTRIRMGEVSGGREDLLVAAAQEPQRAVLRSYLGKAYFEERDDSRALPELERAMALDPGDPTAWLYSALLKHQQNRVNESIEDLEHSRALNENRRVYRSGLLLDQDRAVRSANLAQIYRDAGLEDVALREAAQAVVFDYANYSAHLFLANSYHQLAGPNPYELRYQPLHLSEYLLASLLGPADGRLLAQPVSQQEYTRLFERDTLGFSSSTEYWSRGAWNQNAVQFGTWGNTSYALEGGYLWDPGETKNGSTESWVFSAKAKQILSAKDGLYVQVVRGHTETGDVAPRYDPDDATADFKLEEEHGPTVLIGLDHQWSEAHRTLMLLSHFRNELVATNPHSPVILETQTFGVTDAFVQTDLSLKYRNELSANSVELQHLALTGPFQTIAGIRAQNIEQPLRSVQFIQGGNATDYEIYFGNAGDTIADVEVDAEALRVSPYVYEHWRVFPFLLLVGGLSYDYQELPSNTRFPPPKGSQDSADQWSPKVGAVITPTDRATLRGAWSRSLGGFNIDQDVRLEPTQVAGFGQVYRNLIPPAMVGVTSGDSVEVANVSFEYRFPTRTYAAVGVGYLESEVDDEVGGFQRDLFTSQGPAIQIQRSLRFEERSLNASVHQLLGDWFSVGASYRLSEAQLEQSYPQMDSALGGNASEYEGLLHTVKLQATVNLPIGLYARAEALWCSQSLRGDLAGLPGDDFWQENVYIGYRLPRRHAEITVGVLNLSGESYRLHPINLYPNLPRSRTLYVRLQLNF